MHHALCASPSATSIRPNDHSVSDLSATHFPSHCDNPYPSQLFDKSNAILSYQDDHPTNRCAPSGGSYPYWVYPIPYNQPSICAFNIVTSHFSQNHIVCMHPPPLQRTNERSPENAERRQEPKTQPRIAIQLRACIASNDRIQECIEH